MLKALKLFDSPFIVRHKQPYQDSHFIRILGDYHCGGGKSIPCGVLAAHHDLTDLSSWLTRRGKFDSATSRVIACETASAMLHMQRLKYAFRNLKPESILLSAAGHVRIHDFEFVKFLDGAQRATTLIG